MASEIMNAVLFFILLIVLAPLLGSYIYNLSFNRNPVGIKRKLLYLEILIYKAGGVNHQKDMNWKEYSLAVLWFHIAGLVLLFLIQVTQSYLPLNPQGLPNVNWALALNTAISFVTNTNWQSYAGEVTMSYFTQMIGLTVQNFLSAATGAAILFAIARGLITRQGTNLGNFWVDLVRFTLYVLFPLAVFFAITLVSNGVVQTFSDYLSVTTLEGGRQTIPIGPAASQVAIKQLGTNGGGFFNTNSAFPFENPTPFTNMLQMLALVLIPGALVFTFGKIIGSSKQAWIIFGVMVSMLLGGFIISAVSEYSYNPVMGLNGLMEGKEIRHGILSSVLWSTATTAASNGSVNAMHSSLTPLAGMIAVLNIMLGEIIFGGVGSGMYGMLLFIFLTVFISGLMVGRSPEYLGKKIDAQEIKLTILAIILPGLVILIFTAIALTSEAVKSSASSFGPHALAEIMYAFSSAAGNNGSAYAGLNANTVFYNLMLGLAMLVGRFGVIFPVLAIAGSFANKNITPESQGTLHTDTLLFAFLLVSVILIVGALTFFPALTLGQIIEHLLLVSGRGI